MAAAKGATISQLALAWILAQRDYIVPIPAAATPSESTRTWPPPTSS